MNTLIVTVSLALVIGKSHCQLYGNAVPTSPLTSSATPGNDSASSLALNGATMGSNSTNLNGDATLNTSLASNPASDWANTNSSFVAGNSSTYLNSTGTTAGVFLMNEDIYWATTNFSVYDQNGNVTYQITRQQEGSNLNEKEFVVQDANSGLKKLRIDAHTKACGFGQTYEADDGTKFRLDPRAFLSDRWYIKNPSSDSEYVYKRAALSIDGKIYEKERVVAQVETHTNSTISSVSTRQVTLHSDGTIPPWDLIALLALVKTRVHACGY